MSWATIEWDIHAEMRVVQACVDNAAETAQFQRITCQLYKSTEASRTYHCLFEGKQVAKFTLSVLPQDHTRLRGYKAYDPIDDAWQVEYVRRQIPSEQQSEPLRALLMALDWQIQEGIFWMSASQPFERAAAREKRKQCWKKFGLEDPDLLAQAFEEFNQRNQPRSTWREQKFEYVLRVIKAEILSIGVPFTITSEYKSVAELLSGASASDPRPKWESIPEQEPGHQIARLWCDGLTANEIGGRVGLSAGRVYNILTAVRAKYPHAHIPYHSRRKKS